MVNVIHMANLIYMSLYSHFVLSECYIQQVDYSCYNRRASKGAKTCVRPRVNRRRSAGPPAERLGSALQHSAFSRSSLPLSLFYFIVDGLDEGALFGA